MISSKLATMTHSGAKFISITFNKNICQAIHIITIYKPPTLSIHHFINFLQTNLYKIQENCPTIVIGDFNINMIMKMFESLALQNLMSQYNFKLYFSKPITLYQAHINHIWTNASTQQSHFDTTQAY
jgi:hypothetical protein